MVYLDTDAFEVRAFSGFDYNSDGSIPGAAVATLSGVLIPLLAIVQHHELNS